MSDDASLKDKIKHTLIGKPKSIKDPTLFHKLALIPLLAWIGLGADGLSSASYGPEEAFRTLGPTPIWPFSWPWPRPSPSSSSPTPTAGSSSTFPPAAAATSWPRIRWARKPASSRARPCSLTTC